MAFVNKPLHLADILKFSILISTAYSNYDTLFFYCWTFLTIQYGPDFLFNWWHQCVCHIQSASKVFFFSLWDNFTVSLILLVSFLIAFLFHCSHQNDDSWVMTMPFSLNNSRSVTTVTSRSRPYVHVYSWLLENEKSNGNEVPFHLTSIFSLLLHHQAAMGAVTWPTTFPTCRFLLMAILIFHPLVVDHYHRGFRLPRQNDDGFLYTKYRSLWTANLVNVPQENFHRKEDIWTCQVLS